MSRREEIMINLVENLLKEVEAKKAQAVILEEEVLLLILLIWKMLMIYLKNFSEAEILLLDSLMMMMTSFQEVSVIQVLEWWETWNSKIMVAKNNKKIDMILFNNLEWVLMMTMIFLGEDLVADLVEAISKHSHLIVLAAWVVEWEHQLVNKL